jgi:O-antigen/teichoic acid export membrane protein
VNLATTLSLISAVVYATTLPGVIEVCREGERSSSRRVVEDMALLMFIPGGLGIAVLAGAGSAISKLLFGNAYRGDHGLVAVLAFAELGVFAGTAVAAVLIAVNRRRALLVGTTVALAIDVVLCLLFLNSFGAMAAAWASLVSYGAAAIVAVWLAPDARSIATPLVRVTIKVALAAAIGAVVTAILPAVAGVAVGSLVYIASAALLFHRDLNRARQSFLQRRARPKS